MRNPLKFLVNSFTLSRLAQFSPDALDTNNRNLSKECGWPEHITLHEYHRMFDRDAIGSRAVEVFPDETWSVIPAVYETEDPEQTPFEKEFEALVNRVHFWHYMKRIDILSGIGRYGVLFLGFNDSNASNPSLPVSTMPGIRGAGRPGKVELLFLRAFPESLASVDSFVKDPTDPRFGQPDYYNITFSDPSGPVPSENPITMKVHWSRVIHVADNRTTSEVYGTPRLEKIFDRILDLRKVLGSSAEMFYKGGFPGYVFETHPDSDLDFDKDSVTEEFEMFQNGLQRMMRLQGMTAKSLEVQIADPTNHVTQQLTAICAALKVPLRVFLGSEAGHLASTQDVVNWNRRLKNRWQTYVDPLLIRPTIDRLVAVGALPPYQNLILNRRDLNSNSDKDLADIGLKTTQAMLQYVTSGSYTVVKFFHYLTLFLKFSDGEAYSMIEAAGGEQAIEEKLNNLREIQMKGTGKEDPSAKTFSSGDRNALGKGNPPS